MLALTFASGSGAGVYWATSSDSKSSDSKQEAPPPDEVTEVTNSTARATQQDEQHAMARSGEEIAEDHPHARSAADILWAMEQAYQDQERRIRLLEAALEERIQDESEEGESLHEAHALLQVPGDSDVVTEVDPTPAEPVVHRHETQVVVHIHEAVEKPTLQADLAAQANPAAAVAQQVFVVNHYQPVFMNDQLWTQSLNDVHSDARGFNPSASTNRPGQNSWVAPGFDIYSNHQPNASGQLPLFQRSTVRRGGFGSRTR